MDQGTTEPRLCIDCSAEMPPITGRGNFSPRCKACRAAYRKADNIQRSRAHYAAIRNPAMTYTCEVCQGVFDRPNMDGPLPRKCPDCGKAEKLKRDAAARRARTTERRQAEFVCQICGETKPVQRLGPVPDYCEPCRPEYFRRSALARYAPAPERGPTPCEGGCGVMVEQPRKGLRSRCDHCAARRRRDVIAAWWAARPELKSAKSREQKRRRRLAKKGINGERFTDREIFERDGWICGICSQPVDPDLKYPDLMSASLDHKIPLAYSKHLNIDLHVRANAQCAHFLCNSRKGDRIEDEELDRLLAQLLAELVPAA